MTARITKWCSRKPQHAAPELEEGALGAVAAEVVIVNHYGQDQRMSSREQAEQLVRHFHKTVHGIDGNTSRNRRRPARP